MKVLELKVPPLVVLLLAALGMWALPEKIEFQIAEKPALVLSFVALLIGVFLIGCVIKSFKTLGTTISPINPEKTSLLITEGVFSYSRNPIYLGCALVLCGFSFYTNHIFSLVFVLFFMMYIQVFQISPEEKVLDEKFGEDFKAYKEKVPRWVGIKAGCLLIFFGFFAYAGGKVVDRFQKDQYETRLLTASQTVIDNIDKIKPGMTEYEISEFFGEHWFGFVELDQTRLFYLPEYKKLFLHFSRNANLDTKKKSILYRDTHSNESYELVYVYYEIK